MYTDVEEDFINHWNDILTFPTVNDLVDVLCEPKDVLFAKYRTLSRRVLLLKRKELNEPTFNLKIEEDIEGEIWTSLLGYDAYYQVSDHGRVRSLSRFIKGKPYRGKVLKQPKTTKGYLAVSLSFEGQIKQKMVHRAVLESFTGFHPNLLVRHIDSNRQNNKLKNLVWGTPQENSYDLEAAYDTAALALLDHSENM